MEEVRLSGDPAAPVSSDFAWRTGHVLRSAADRLRSSRVLEREDMQRLRPVPDALDSVGEYLERRQLRGVRLDAERLIVARPVVALFAAALVGYAAGRAVRR